MALKPGPAGFTGCAGGRVPGLFAPAPGFLGGWAGAGWAVAAATVMAEHERESRATAVRWRSVMVASFKRSIVEIDPGGQWVGALPDCPARVIGQVETKR